MLAGTEEFDKFSLTATCFHRPLLKTTIWHCGSSEYVIYSKLLQILEMHLVYDGVIIESDQMDGEDCHTLARLFTPHVEHSKLGYTSPR